MITSNTKTTKMYTITNLIEVQTANLADQEVKATRAFGFDDMQVSDGFHTMDELYEHRITLYIALCRKIGGLMNLSPEKPLFNKVWRSKVHSDGSVFEGWFVLGIGIEEGKQITYHLPLHKWEETGFAEELDKAPTFDGHTPADVITRLATL